MFKLMFYQNLELEWTGNDKLVKTNNILQQFTITLLIIYYIPNMS